MLEGEVIKNCNQY